ncbi:MAG: hypothetical protein ABFE01_06940 [Phycisphaerales bacterium]
MENRPGSRTRLYVAAELFCFLLIVGLALLYLHYRSVFAGRNATAGVADWTRLPVPAEGAARLAISLEETPLQEVDERVRYSFLGGDTVSTDSQGDPDVNYPAFHSAKPLYGRVRLDDGGGSPRHLYFAIDHSEGKPGDYDLLYLDEDGDCDLRNNTPRRRLRDPNGLPPTHSDIETIWFESVHVPLQFEPGTRRAVELLPRLWLRKDRELRLGLVAAAVHKGEFAIDGKTCEAFLGYGYAVTGRLDSVFSTLCLRCEDGEYAGLFGTTMDRLAGMRLLGDQWCQFSCSPAGDQLFVYPYQGPLGVLQLGTGGRDAKRLEMFGELRTAQGPLILGRTLANGLPQGSDRYEIPIGDYSPGFLAMRVGDTRFRLSPDSYDQEGRRIAREHVVRKIRIREKKPFVLDFPGKSSVVFIHPPNASRFAAGDQMRVEAVLADSGLDMTIAGISDMTQSETKVVTMADGRKMMMESGPSLQPKVVVKRSNGDVVAQGDMPFGWNGVCAYSWGVPKDLKLDGKEETFTIFLTYDTGELYGTVTGSRQFTVYRD